MHVRLAKRDDFEKVTEFYYKLIDDMGDDAHKPMWQKGIYPEDAFVKKAAEEEWLYVLEDEGEIVGSTVINHHAAEGYDAVEWGCEAESFEVTVIHIFGIAKRCQGKGAGSFFLKNIIEICRKMGQKAVRLDALNANIPAQRLYEKNGFSNRGVKKLFYEDTGLTDFVLYEYIL